MSNIKTIEICKRKYKYQNLLLYVVILFLVNEISYSQYGKWTKLFPSRSHNEAFFFPRFRAGAGMAKLTDGKILLFGGYGGGKRNNDTWIFDLELNTWIKIKPNILLHQEQNTVYRNYMMEKFSSLVVKMVRV